MRRIRLNKDAAAEDPSVDPTNQVLNPEAGQGARDFQGFATKDGEIIEQDGNPLNTSTEKPARVAAKPAAKKDDTTHRDPQKRIDQSVAKQRAAERRADLAEAKLANFEARMANLEAARGQPAIDKTKAATTSEVGPPDPAKYQYAEADARYIRDLSLYETHKAMAEERKCNRLGKATAQQQAAAKSQHRIKKLPSMLGQTRPPSTNTRTSRKSSLTQRCETSGPCQRLLAR